MRRFLSIFVVLLVMAGMTACGKADEDVLHLGLNAVVLEIDLEGRLIYVKDADEGYENVFGEQSAIDCSKIIDRGQILYVDYDSENNQDPHIIQFEDLKVGDMVILSIYESELNSTDAILAEQIQLSTQRLD